MKLKEIKTKNLDIEWEILINADLIDEKVDAKCRGISGDAKLPGFRPGKVPLNVIKQRYSKTVIPEVLDEVVNSSVKDFVVKKKLRPAVQPKIEIKKYEEGSDLLFKVSFQIMPEIENYEIKKISIEKLELEYKEDDLNRSLEEIAKKHERFLPLKQKRKAKLTDLILFDYEGSIKGKPFKGSSGKDESVVLGSNKYIPGYEEQMIGTHIDEEKIIFVTFPEDYRLAEIANKEAQFKLKIKDIQEKAENILIDDQLAQEVGEKDLNSLKDKIKERMLADFNKFSMLKARREVTDYLLERSKFELPSRMIDDEINFLKAQNENSKEKMKDTEIKKSAERRVKLGLILNKIGSENKIEVSDEDLTKSVVNEAQKYPGEEKKVVDFYKKNPQMMNNLRGIAFEEKVVNFILNSCSTKLKKCTFDQLFNSDVLKSEKELVKNKNKEIKNE